MNPVAPTHNRCKEGHVAARVQSINRYRSKDSKLELTPTERAGIEGTVSQGVRAFGLRKARYRGLKKTHLQELSTATAVNVRRIANWLNGVPTALTRRSPLAALAQVS
jgi:transposase